MALDFASSPLDILPQPPGAFNTPVTAEQVAAWGRQLVTSLQQRQQNMVDAQRTQLTQLQDDYIAADEFLSAGITIELGVLTTDLAAVATRVTTLESQVQTPTTGLLARVTVTEATLATHDTAIASISSEIVAARDGETSLLAKITSIDTAIVDEASARASTDTTITASVTSLSGVVDTKARVFRQASAPTATAVGDLWIDSDDGNLIYRWDGSSWVQTDDARIATNTATIATHATSIATNTSAIATLNTTVSAHTTSLSALTTDVGDLQTDMVDAQADIITNASAITTLNSSVSSLSTTVSSHTTSISGLTTTVDTKARTFAQTSAPSATAIGDLWIDTDDDNKLYRATATGSGSWVAVPDARISVLSASVTTLATTVTDLGSDLTDLDDRVSAFYGIYVDAGTHEASLVLLADGGGSPGTQIILTADIVSLEALAINFGDNTTFEDTYNSFYTEDGTYRFRFGGPFPGASESVMWFGPVSVDLDDETRTNGIWSFGSDGKVYYGAAELTAAVISATSSPSSISVAHAHGSFTSGSITVTPAGGSGYTYQAQVIKNSGAASAPTLDTYTAATFTLSGSVGSGQDVVGRIAVTITSGDGRSCVLLIPYNFSSTD